MKGDPKVIELLNAAIREELTAICQYILHAEMQINWGYQGIGGFIKKQAIDEMRHLDLLIERVLFLDGTPKLDVPPTPKVGANVKEQLANDLAAEEAAVKMYNGAVATCAAAGDSSSRALFEKLVQDEEVHADWLEAQMGLIKEIGYEKYLTQQLKGQAGA